MVFDFFLLIYLCKFAEACYTWPPPHLFFSHAGSTRFLCICKQHLLIVSIISSSLLCEEYCILQNTIFEVSYSNSLIWLWCFYTHVNSGMVVSICVLSLQRYNCLYWLFSKSGICSPPIRCPPQCCRCCRAAWIGCCPQVFTDSVYWHWEDLHLNTYHCCFSHSFFWLRQVYLWVWLTIKMLTLSWLEFVRHVQCLMGIMKTCTASRSYEITSSR